MPLQHIVVRPDGDARLDPYGVIFPVTPGDDRIPIPLEHPGAAGHGVFTATVIRARSSQATGSIRGMERHPHSVQAFVPLSAYRLVAVTASGREPPTEPGQLAVLHIPAGWGFAWHPGVWHTGMMGDGMDAALVSMVRRIPDGSDTETITLPFSINPAEPHAHG
ncbi:ureidoglycolate lyase [Bordetella genomosp. 11]|uniref:Ureidoglycolate hydrolase n=1 Tax=Bordetella genomosp. 11 TaxID=1416808 RepID=A0A261UKD1_9BORD|nr:ureidoglycolate lyase [Bordetella genomosp. 11]OZI61842.1 hypothetical protein CAL28_21610 [Bordetella genomosp. 11]